MENNRKLIKCIGSGSSGNCYLLTANSETLILDAGMPIKEIKRGLNYDISHVAGCVVTHGHIDHHKSVKDIRLLGIPVFAPYLGEKKTQVTEYGGFHIVSFEVPHDGEPCVGFYITNGDLRMIYATDYEYIPVRFKRQKLTAMLIECNHVSDLLSDEEAKYSHSVFGHASLDVTKGIVAANKTESLKVVILCHLSNGWSDEGRMAAEVKEVAGNVNVHIANAGESYQLFPYI